MKEDILSYKEMDVTGYSVENRIKVTKRLKEYINSLPDDAEILGIITRVLSEDVNTGFMYETKVFTNCKVNRIRTLLDNMLDRIVDLLTESLK